MLRVFFHNPNTCYGRDKSAKLLCESSAAIEQFDVQTLETLLTQMPENSEGYRLLDGALATYKSTTPIAGVPLSTLMQDEITTLRLYYQTNAIAYQNDTIYVPYKYIVPLNVSYNWSLQNLSSYYTDIGFVRLFLFAINILAVVYSAIKKDQKLLVISTTSLFGRVIWWIIGGGIVWYGIGLIIWLVMVLAAMAERFATHAEDDTDKFMLYFVLGLLVLWGTVQLVLNLVRISSQGATGPFVWYKMHAGKVTEYTTQLQPVVDVSMSYGQQDVFDLQFPHYNQIIDQLAQRSDDE